VALTEPSDAYRRPAGASPAGEPARARAPVDGTIVRVNGPMVEIEGIDGVSLADLVEVGERRLPGEVVGIRGSITTAQVYEYTGGLRVGDRATSQRRPLSVRLGPGLIGGVFDGLLRPLAQASDFLGPGASVSAGSGVRGLTMRAGVCLDGVGVVSAVIDAGVTREMVAWKEAIADLI
jgi:V/A-type H+-transporting ATPase subunit A